MKTVLVATFALVFAWTLSAQETETPMDGAVGDKIKLVLKTDDAFEGELLKVDADGVKIDIGDDTELFIRWSFTRGADHLALRKRCVDWKSVESLTKLADFCHEFALDEEEARVLYRALKIDPDDAKLMARFEALPKPDDLGEDNPTPETEPEVEPETEPGTEPDTEPETEPAPADPPPSVSASASLFVDITTDDDASKTWLDEEFEKAGFKVGKKSKHDIRVEVEITFTLTANPDFFGSELYAMYDGKVIVKLYEKGNKKAFHSYEYEEKELKRDTRALAKKDMRSALLTEALRDTHRELTKRAND